MLAKDIKRGEIIHKVFDLAEVKDYSFKDPDTGEMILRQKFTITSNRRDRDRDVVDPSGAMIEDYANNPVVLWAHQYTEIPLARSIEMERIKEASVDKDGNTVENNSIAALVTYVPDSIYQKNWTGLTGSMVYEMYKQKFLNAVSIGFDPHEWEAIEEKDSKKTPTDLLDMVGGFGGTKFTVWDMLEFSFVPVPSNPSALVDRKMKKQFMKSLRGWADETIVKCDSCAEAESKSVLKSEELEVEDVTNMEIEKTFEKLEGMSKDELLTFIKTLYKAGAVLSGPNKTLLQTSSDNILKVLASAESNAPAPAAPAAPAKPNAPAVGASTEPVITASYPLGHDVADVLKQIEIARADDVIPVMDDGEKPEEEPQELFAVDQEILAEVLGIDVATLEGLNAQAEGEKTEE